MNLLKNKQIYKILSELNNIGITENFDELKRFYEYEQIGYSPEEEFKSFETIFSKSNNNNILSNFIENNKIYFSTLEEKGYIKIIKTNWEYTITFPILTDKGKIFLENYEEKKALFSNINLITIMTFLTLIVTIIGVFYTVLSYYK